MNKKLAIQIGAGNIGRGLNAYILDLNNYKITFLDNSKEVIFQLNKLNSYDINEIDKINSKKTISNFNALNILNEELILKNILDYSLITISIGFNNLIKLKNLFIKIIKKIYKSKLKKNLNIIAIENGINASTHLKKILFNELSLEEKKFVDKYIGFVNCSVDRIASKERNSKLNINVESFYELVLDENSWKGKKLKKGVKYSKNVIKYIERKFYMLNALHCFIAWKGIQNNFKYIYQFQEFQDLKKEAILLLEEFKNILINKYNFSQEELDIYSKKVVQRLSNKKIKDEVFRVGKNVKRKISENDRFIKPLKYSIKNNLENTNIIKAISIAFNNLDFKDKELNEINEYMNKNKIKKTIKKYTNIQNEEIINKIIKYAKNN